MNRARKPAVPPQQEFVLTGRESYGLLAGSRERGYVGGAVCPACIKAVTFAGRFMSAEDCPTGAHIALTSKASGRRFEGEVRAKRLRFTCPSCGTYAQLAVEIDGPEDAPVAVFVATGAGG